MNFQDNGSVWESIADLMTGLMLIFSFVSIGYMYELEQVKMTQINTKQEIYEDLNNAFTPEILENWGAELDKDTLTISFVDPNVTFEKGKYNISPAYKAILYDFLPKYIAILEEQEKKGNKIKEVRIEGHASKEWGGTTGTLPGYYYNMELSQNRARSVLQCALAMPALVEHHEWLKQKITTNGFSTSQSTDDENMDRRVDFRIVTTSEQELIQLMEGLPGEDEAQSSQ